MKGQCCLVAILGEVVHQLILGDPNYGKRSKCRPLRIFIDQLLDDIGIKKEEMDRAMNDRNEWKDVVIGVHSRIIQERFEPFIYPPPNTLQFLSLFLDENETFNFYATLFY